MNYDKAILQYSTAYERKIYFHKLKNGKIRFLCSDCGETWFGKLKDLRDIQRSHLCPKCFANISNTTDKEQYITKFVFDECNIIDGCYWGYAIHTTIKNARKYPSVVERMFKIDGFKHYIRNYHFTWMGYYWGKFTHDYVYDKGIKNVNTKWRITHSNRWRDYFNAIYTKESYERLSNDSWYLSYKDYLEKIPYKLDIKSNQRYVIQHNLMNYRQIAYMVAFNLKSTKEISKYNAYIRKHDIGQDDCIYNLNIYDLEYISKNGISVRTYTDYIRVCSALGIKDKHPKNFAERDGEVQALYTEFENEKKFKKYEKKIVKINLPKTQFKANSEEYYINAYHSASELKNDAKTFRNCIYNNYLEDYANRKTDLYRCINSQGKLIACIEIYKGKVEQIMGKDNTRPKLYKQIRTALVEMVA